MDGSETSSERPAPAAEGELATTPLLHLFVYALEKRLTGTLELAAPAGVSAEVRFRDGRPAKVRTSEPVAYLGQVLVDLGHLTSDELDRSLAKLSAEKKLHGQLLVEPGLLHESELEDALLEQLARKVCYLFSLPKETRFAYYDRFDALAGWGDDGPSLDPLPLVWTAVREATPPEQIETALARVGATPLRLSGRAAPDRFGFAGNEGALIELLRARPMTVAELEATGILPARDVERLVYCLLLTQQIQLVQEAPGPRLDATRSAPPPRRSTPPPAFAGKSAAEALTFAMHAATASVFPPPTRPTPTPVFVQGKSSRPPSWKPPPLEHVPVPTMTAAEIAALPLELIIRRDEILARAETIDREDYFTMLDVDTTASATEVNARFLELAKTWHPDRISERIPDAREECARIFARMSEAHRTLVEPERRVKYMKLVEQGAATPAAQATIAAVLDAAMSFQKAEVFLKREDYAQAESYCARALAGDPDRPEYAAMAAWLDALKPESQSPRATKECVARLTSAIRKSKKCERAYFYRGQLHKRLGDALAAARDFRIAAALDPNNIDAAREVRLYKMRRRRGTTPPTS